MSRKFKLTTATVALMAFMSGSALALPGEDGPDSSDDGFGDPRTAPAEQQAEPAPQPEPEPEPQPEPMDRTPAPAEPSEPACVDSITGCPVDNPWLIRLRGIGVIPDDGTFVDAVGGEADISNTFVPEIDFTYFFTERIGVEAIVATSRHEARVQTRDGNTIIQDLGDLWILPPAVTVTYRWNPRGDLQPYVGAGAQVVLPYAVNNPPGLDIDYGIAAGPTLQAGFDMFVTENLLVNVDVKRSFMDINVDIDPIGLDPDVDLDPWVVGFGVGWKF
jgi:outer membrane protein